jgi:DNA recombination protein RmuC
MTNMTNVMMTIWPITILTSIVVTWFLTKRYFLQNFIDKSVYYQLQRDLDKAQMSLQLKEQEENNKDQFIVKQQEVMQTNFENLANKILESREEKFDQYSQKGLMEVLQPFKVKIHELQEKIDKTYQDESRERFALKSELLRIIEAGKQMSLETSNLTKALKGDVKMQGNWGELVLDRVLSIAGLREGEEYIKQGQSLGLKFDDGSSAKPDVIIALPEGKHLIIDSKVSLISYERVINAESVDFKNDYTKEFLKSLYQHIDDLSSKRYHLNEKLLAPDFTILFIPIEGAFAFSMGAESELFSYAWSKSIVLAGPVNLLTTLKTVGSLWRQDRQNKHVLTIATEAGKLYDKTVAFLEDMLKVGDQLEKAKNSYALAMNKISYGKGNMISKMLQLKEMGIKHSKNIPVELSNIEEYSTPTINLQKD